MTSPTPQELQVATDALRTEARVWQAQSAQLQAICGKARNMQLGRIEAGVFQLIVGPYNELVNTVTARCDEGVTAMADIGANLRNVAQIYEDEDAAGEHRMRNLY